MAGIKKCKHGADTSTKVPNSYLVTPAVRASPSVGIVISTYLEKLNKQSDAAFHTILPSPSLGAVGEVRLHGHFVCLAPGTQLVVALQNEPPFLLTLPFL